MLDDSRNYEGGDEGENTGTIADAIFCLTNHRGEVDDHPEMVCVNKGALDELLDFLKFPLDEGEEPSGWKELPLNSGNVIGEGYLRRIFNPKHGLPFTKLMDLVVQTCPARGDED